MRHFQRKHSSHVGAGKQLVCVYEGWCGSGGARCREGRMGYAVADMKEKERNEKLMENEHDKAVEGERTRRKQTHVGKKVKHHKRRKQRREREKERRKRKHGCSHTGVWCRRDGCEEQEGRLTRQGSTHTLTQVREMGREREDRREELHSEGHTVRKATEKYATETTQKGEGRGGEEGGSQTRLYTRAA